MDDMELMQKMGTDGQQWAHEFLKAMRENHWDNSTYEAMVHSWFAVAIETGRSAGLEGAMQQIRLKAEELGMDFSEIYIPDYAIEVAYKTGMDRAIAGTPGKSE